MAGLGRREASVAGAVIALGLVLAVVTPGFFARDNLSDLFLANMPVLIIALGMTLVILTGHIDISVGSLFAVCAVSSGVLAKAGLPMPLVVAAACAIGVAVTIAWPSPTCWRSAWWCRWRLSRPFRKPAGSKS